MKREPKTDFPDSGKVMRARITTIQDCHDKAGFQTVVFAGQVVLITAQGCMGCEVFKPAPEILMETSFVVVYEDGSRDMHGINETKALDNLALFEAAFNIASDVDKTDPFRGFEPEFLAIAFH